MGIVLSELGLLGTSSLPKKQTTLSSEQFYLLSVESYCFGVVQKNCCCLSVFPDGIPDRKNQQP